MFGYVLLFHVLGATVWTGGHLVLALTVLPKVMRDKSPEELLRFEPSYEKIGMPALLIQVVTGVWLAHTMLPEIGAWTNLNNPVSRLILLKLSLLAITILFAVDAKFRVFPKLNENNLNSMAFHIIVVTLLSVLFVIVGVSFQTGWLS